MQSTPNLENLRTTESERLNSLIISQLDDYYKTAPVKMGKDGKGYDDLKRAIVANLDKLYIQSNKDDFYWFDCSLKTYEATFSQRLQGLNRNFDPDATELDLLIMDYRTFDLLTRQRVLIAAKNPSIGSLDYGIILEGNSNSHQSLTKFNDARKRKMEFIQNFFERKNSKIIKDGDDFRIVTNNVRNTIGEENNNTPNLAYKIALLEESGILKALNQNGWKKINQYKFLAELFNVSERMVKGNCLVLNPKSEEDRFRYTAADQLENARDFINKISK